MMPIPIPSTPARPLYDGEQVNVYHSGPPPIAPAGKSNINKASAGELMTLPQIGEGRAQKIIEHREYGPYRYQGDHG